MEPFTLFHAQFVPRRSEWKLDEEARNEVKADLNSAAHPLMTKFQFDELLPTGVILLEHKRETDGKKYNSTNS